MYDEMRMAKIESMRRSYPSLRLVSNEGGTSVVWEGTLQPIRLTDELDAILDDLEHDRKVLIVPGEDHEIRHHPACRIVHSKHRLTEQVHSPQRVFTILVEDYCDGRTPFARVLEPVITDELRKHNWGKDGICGFAPWKFPWHKDESPIDEFVDHSLIWLFKWNTYSQSEPKTWIGSETDHKPRFLLATIKVHEPCWCGKGKPYHVCCRSADAYAAFGKDWIYFLVWLRRHDSDLGRFESISRRLASLRKNK